MLKRLGKRVLPIIMATMLVASIGTLSTYAVEVDTEENTIEATASTTSTYVDEYSGVKFESDSMTLSESSVYVFDGNIDIIPKLDLYEKMYNINVYEEGYEYADLSKIPVTAYLPCENEGCYVVFMDYESGEVVQLDAEYVDGYYKVQMAGVGAYFICDYALAEGEGELVEQTLVDETTGVSVSGLIPTDSKLVVVDLMAMCEKLIAELENYESEHESVGVIVNEEALELLDKMDGYMVYVIRNFDIAKTKGELTVNLPSEFEGYEVRYIDANVAESEEYESILTEYEVIESELSNPTISDEELAEKINAFIDKVMPALASEYVDGNYIVNNENCGIFMIVPTESLHITAEDVKIMREEYVSYEETPTEPTGVVNTVATENHPTQAVQQTVVQTTATQAATTSSTSGKTVSTGDSRSVPAFLAVLGTATAAIVAFRKKRLAK